MDCNGCHCYDMNSTDAVIRYFMHNMVLAMTTESRRLTTIATEGYFHDDRQASPDRLS